MLQVIERVTVILDTLESLGIGYSALHHEPIMTVDDGIAIAEQTGVEPCKCLLAESRRHEFVMILARGSKAVPMKEIGVLTGMGHLSFASPDRLMELLCTEPGAVSPLGLIFDKNHKVRLVIDRKLASNKSLMCHPNDNSCSLVLSTDDFLNRFLPAAGHSDYMLF